MSITSDLKMFGRYAIGLPRFIRDPLTVEEADRLIATRIANREGTFLAVLKQGVFGNSASPYRALFAHLGIEYGDVAGLVRERGVEDALGDLHDAGVRISLEEVRGRTPIVRDGLEIHVGARDLDNPLLVKHYEAQAGGSRTAGRRTPIDFDALRRVAAYDLHFLRSFGLLDAPAAVWRASPPGIAGFARVLIGAKLRLGVQRWFSQTPAPGLRAPKQALIAGYASQVGRLWGRPVPYPEHTPADQAGLVAGWLAERRDAGAPGLVHTTPSAAVRVCVAAQSLGLDIEASFFQVSGEPYTEAKARIVREAGCRAGTHYYMSELGLIGVGCRMGATPDDVHVATDGVGVVQRQRAIGPGAMVPSLLYTTLLPTAPRIMINVESGDYGVLTESACECSLGALGLRTHVHTIRSFDKLTSEGMNFVGGDLMVLLEEVLPERFGGSPTDYQLVEEEAEGLSRVRLVISPAVGDLDEAEIVDAVLDFLRGRGGPEEMMTDIWRGAHTLGVVRREPYATAASKVLPLHLIPAAKPGGS